MQGKVRQYRVSVKSAYELRGQLDRPLLSPVSAA